MLNFSTNANFRSTLQMTTFTCYINEQTVFMSWLSLTHMQQEALLLQRNRATRYVS